MNAFQLAWINLKRRKDSTLIAVLAIALSIMSSGVLLRLYWLSGQREDDADRAVVAGSAVCPDGGDRERVRRGRARP